MRRIIAMLLVIGSLLVCASSCKKKQEQPGDVSAIQVIDKDTKTSAYVIVRPQNMSSQLREALVKLTNAIEEKTGVKLTVKDDFYKNESEISEFEILLGSTNRAESTEAFNELKYDEYLIGVRGKKLVILGGSDEATANAVNYFIENKLDESMRYNQKNIAFCRVTYPVSTYKLDGTDISEFRIVYEVKNDAAQAAANRLQEALIDRCGIALKMKSSSIVNSAEHEILIGKCNKDFFIPESEIPGKYDYKVLFRDGKIALGGGSAFAICYAVEEMLNSMFNITDSVATLSQQECKGEIEHENSFLIISNNVKGDDDTPTRAPTLVNLYKSYQPDILCLQECNDTSYSLVVENLTDTYGVAGKSITGTTDTSYTPILYDKNRYTLVEEYGGLFTDRYTGTKTKTFSMAVLREKATGKQFVVANAHFALFMAAYATYNPAKYSGYSDAKEGAEWRKLNALQIMDRYKKFTNKYGNIPLVLTGDFNGERPEGYYTYLTKTLSDCSLSAVYADPDVKTHHSTSSVNAGLPIDYIFFTKNQAEVFSCEYRKEPEALRATDHLPVLVEMRWK